MGRKLQGLTDAITHQSRRLCDLESVVHEDKGYSYNVNVQQRPSTSEGYRTDYNTPGNRRFMNNRGGRGGIRGSRGSWSADPRRINDVQQPNMYNRMNMQSTSAGLESSRFPTPVYPNRTDFCFYHRMSGTA